MSKTKGQKAYLERESQNSFNPKDQRPPHCMKAGSPASSAVKRSGAFPQDSKQTNRFIFYISDHQLYTVNPVQLAHQ